MPEGAWFYDAVQHIAQLGITAGCSDGAYCPGENVTRAQMAVFLSRAITHSSNGAG